MKMHELPFQEYPVAHSPLVGKQLDPLQYVFWGQGRIEGEQPEPEFEHPGGQ